MSLFLLTVWVHLSYISYLLLSLACGGTFFATRKTQTFLSHIKYGSQKYPPLQNCIWRIRARGRKRRVELRFKKFQLEDKPCNYDFVKVYDGHLPVKRNLLGVECGHSVQTPVYQSTGRTLLVQFKSDTSVSGDGFEAVFVKLRHRLKRNHIRLYDPFKDWAFPSRTRDLYIWRKSWAVKFSQRCSMEQATTK